MSMAKRLVRVGVAAVVATALAGCEGSVSVDLGSEPPANVNIQQLVVPITGVEFRTNSGGTERVEFRNGEAVDLLDYLEGDTLRLLTEEELGEGSYTGVRLLFDQDDEDSTYLTDFTNQEYPLTIEQGEFAQISMTIEEDEDDEFDFTLTVDLRQSLRSNDDGDEFTLQPVLRSARTGNSGTLIGTAEDNCAGGDDFGEEAAVYVFQGGAVEPDDRDGTGVEPYATAAIFFDAFSNAFTYQVSFLPEGRYTVALACRGDLEEPDEDDDLEFRPAREVEIEAEETTEFDVEE
jgi:hypothetical protein